MWNIGGAINQKNIFRIILRLNQIKPGLVSSTFDSYNILRWMGGRPFLNVPRMSPNEFIQKILYLNKQGIGTFHVFSNFYITEKDLEDPDGNYFLETTHDPLNGIVCTSPIFVKYLRKNYPLFKILGSCTLEEKTVDNLKRSQDIYDILIIPPSLNRKYKIIEQLDTHRIEIMVNESCYADCKVRELHYSLINKWNISHALKDLQNYYDFFHGNPLTCYNRNKVTKNPLALFLKKTEIDRYVNMGVQLFKLQERYDELRTIEAICKFVIHFSNESLKTKYKMLKIIPRNRVAHWMLRKNFKAPIS